MDGSVDQWKSTLKLLTGRRLPPAAAATCMHVRQLMPHMVTGVTSDRRSISWWLVHMHGMGMARRSAVVRRQWGLVRKFRRRCVPAAGSS